MKNILFILFFALNYAFAQLTADEILKKVDEVSYAPKDQFFKAKVTLIDKNGKESHRVALMYQKGTNKRFVKFTDPADIRGIGFLSLPGDVNYVYLPAFKKSRRIASHIKNQKFRWHRFHLRRYGSVDLYREVETGNFEKGGKILCFEIDTA
jgi:hypothetical protein